MTMKKHTTYTNGIPDFVPTHDPDAGFSRRKFFFLSAAGTVSGALVGCASQSGSVVSLKRAGFRSPNEKLNVAAIGAGGKGFVDISGLQSENVVALCDIDWKNAAGAFKKWPDAKQYKDFRVMLEKEKIDAVNVTTADHTHAIAAAWAMQRGVHVYLQKPLTHNIWEGRKMLELSRKYGVATQMGNQGHSGDGTRKLCELIWSGAIGNVKEVHAWTNRPIWPQGIEKPHPAETVPDHLDWDLFTGPAPMRPFNKLYTPFKWRGWYDYGCGALGDMACHILDSAYWALNLRNPTSVECIKQEGRSTENFPNKSIVRWEFPAVGTRPAVTVYWYDGGWKPEMPAGLPADTKIGQLGDGTNGSLFVGDRGIATTGMLGEGTRLLPDPLMLDYKFPEPTLTRSPGHYNDFIRACKGGEPACSNFEYSVPLNEMVLLGSVAQRFDGKLEWDAEAGTFRNHDGANALVQRQPRAGWELPA